MMRKNMAIVCFTPQGENLAKIIQKTAQEKLLETSWKTEVIYKPVPFRQWMKEHFSALDALVFIGAMGIIVRDMAPCLKSKLTDPAVVTLDEKGQFVISVLSGHLGGANELTRVLAERLGAIPVITTSSDVNGKLAIDVFAKKNNLVITSMKQAKLCASEIVSGCPVSFSCDGRIEGKIPKELSGAKAAKHFLVEVTPYERKWEEKKLHLIPKAFVLGIGCKKGTKEEVIEARVREELTGIQIDLRSVAGIASIDLKQEEEGILTFGKKQQIPLHFYPGEELDALEGEFSKSSFVKEITGTDNVCERAAYRLAMEYGAKNMEECRILPKKGKDGVTIAVMKIEWRVCFE